jgi:hypothetical protein
MGAPSSETKLSGRSLVRARGFGDLVDLCLLRESNRVGDGVLYRLDSKELREAAFAT